MDDALCPFSGVFPGVEDFIKNVLQGIQPGRGKHFRTSFVILSAPADLPLFNFEIALPISGKEISEITSSFKYTWSVLGLSSQGIVLSPSILLVGL